MTYHDLLQHALQMDLEIESENILLRDARIAAFLLDHCEITLPEYAHFFVETNLKGFESRIGKQVMRARIARQPKYRTQADWDAINSCAYYGTADYGHTAPDWQAVFDLGLEGLKQRILRRTAPACNPAYQEATVLVLEAAQRFTLRCAEAARQAGQTTKAEGLAHLATGTPRDLSEAFQLIFLYYHLQQYLDCADVRTLGRLDALTQPFSWYYGNDVVKCELFLEELDAIEATANMPFALGGKNGVTSMSYALLEAYGNLKPPNVKLHILCNEQMPEDFLLLCMACIKEGGNSLVFIQDQHMTQGLIKLGISQEDAQEYTIVGCYEAAARNELPCSCSTRVSLVKPLEYALNQGIDQITSCLVGLPTESRFPTFADLFACYLQNLDHLICNAMDLTRRADACTPSRFAAPFYSAVNGACVEKGGDAYADLAAAYNNSSLVAIGLGTATDALFAIRHLVYEEKLLSLSRLKEILSSNWEGQEPLRQYIRNKLPKYGCGDPQVDEIAQSIARHLSETVNGAPNGHGGIYRLGLFSIDWRTEWGKQTAASADGRKHGETLSQNASATFGMDREGPTGHIHSVTSLPGEDAINGLVMDMELHSSTVSGENGVQVLLSLLKTFLKSGGQTIHFNILDTEILVDAQFHPEKYPNLQVRVCGWNAEFTKMQKSEQEEYILRARMQDR